MLNVQEPVPHWDDHTYRRTCCQGRSCDRIVVRPALPEAPAPILGRTPLPHGSPSDTAATSQGSSLYKIGVHSLRLRLGDVK